MLTVVCLFNSVTIGATVAYDEDVYQLTCGEDNPLVCHLTGDELEFIYIPIGYLYKQAALRVGTSVTRTLQNDSGAFDIKVSLKDLDKTQEHVVSFFVQTSDDASELTGLPFDDCVIQYSDELGWHFKKWLNYTDNIIKYYEYKATPSWYVNSEIKSFTYSLIENKYDDYSRLETIYNWVCDNIYYDQDYANGVSGSTNVSAYDVYKNKYGVCEGYTNLIKAMCTALGISCKIVRQTDGLSGHVWNEAYVDGRWIILDATFGSCNKRTNGNMNKNINTFIRTRYFDMPLNNFSKEHRITSYAPDVDNLALNYHSTWAEDELIEAVQYGLIGDDAVPGFTENITRGEFCKIIVDYVSVQLKNADKFGKLTTSQIQDIMSRGLVGAKIPFVKEQKYITADIVFAYVNGIVKGKSDDYFDVNGYITREDAACMLYRTVEYLHKLDSRYKQKQGFKRFFRDYNRISDYAIVPVEYVTKAGVMQGMTSKMFVPKGNITVEQSYIIFIRLLKSYK